MTQEERQLLLKDLCARLPYGVEIICEASMISLTLSAHMLGEIIKDGNELQWKPYLCPMSSMTEEERNEYFDFRNQELQRVAFAEVGREQAIAEISDWLLARHFDFRGLIEKGLAIEAPEGMYKTE
jgi:hypothetical protein